MVAEAYRKNSNNRSVCYVVGVASSGKVWCFFCFFMFLKGAEQLRFCCILHPFSKVGNSRLHSIPTDYLSFYGIFILGLHTTLRKEITPCMESFGGFRSWERDVSRKCIAELRKRERNCGEDFCL